LHQKPAVAKSRSREKGEGRIYSEEEKEALNLF